MIKSRGFNKRAISTFEIIGSFIVDLYYNHFYRESKRMRVEGRVDSITDGYRYAVSAYINSFNNPDSYRKTVVGIHKYYYTTTRFSTISFSECVDEIVKHFIPVDFFDSTNSRQRDSVLHTVLLNSVKQFSSDVLCSNILKNLIDNHKDITVIRTMQDKMVESLIFERDKMFQKIFKVTNKPVENANYTIITNMKKEMVKLIKYNHTVTKKYNKLKENHMKIIELLNLKDSQLEEMKKLETERVNYSVFKKEEPQSINYSKPMVVDNNHIEEKEEEKEKYKAINEMRDAPQEELVDNIFDHNYEVLGETKKEDDTPDSESLFVDDLLNI